jgi:hypothetical protein
LEERTLAQKLNELMEKVETRGIRELVRKFPRESIIAANYVSSKFRNTLQEIIADEVMSMESKEET